MCHPRVLCCSVLHYVVVRRGVVQCALRGFATLQTLQTKCSHNESCRICMSHVTHTNASCHTYKWVMSHMYESCHTHNASCHTYEWVMSRIYESCHTQTCVVSQIWMRHVTYEWVTSHMNAAITKWLLPAPRNESYHTYIWVIPLMNLSCHTWMNHATFARVRPAAESHLQRVMSHVFITHECVMSHVNESCHIWTQRIWSCWCQASAMNHTPHMYESCHTNEWVMSHMNTANTKLLLPGPLVGWPGYHYNKKGNTM